MPNLTAVLKSLELERNRLSSQLQNINRALAALGTTSHTRSGISVAGRARIAAAQRLRWAKAKGEKVVSIASRRKRKMSAAAISRIRAAQKARWAEWRKKRKKL